MTSRFPGSTLMMRGAMFVRRAGCHSLVALLPLVSAFAASPVRAAAPVNLTFSVQEISENVCPEDLGEDCPGDYYILVNIGANVPGNDFFRHDFPDNVGVIRPARFSTSRLVDTDFGPIDIDVELWDRDDLPDDDQLDIASLGGDPTLTLVYDPVSRSWEGDVPLNAEVSGTISDSARSRFTITDDDRDGDWLQDNWETNGVDLDDSGTIDRDENLPAMGANADRKDVFVELDCLVAANHTHCPTSAAIQDVVQSLPMPRSRISTARAASSSTSTSAPCMALAGS